MNPDASPAGLFATLRRLAASLLVVGRTRLELLANELEVQKLLALRLAVLALALLFLGGLGLLLLIVLAALIWWEQRLAVVGIFTVLVLGAALACWRALVVQLNRPEPPFAASLAELRADIDLLKASQRHAATPE